jgi:hypothetical protein
MTTASSEMLVMISHPNNLQQLLLSVCCKMNFRLVNFHTVGKCSGMMWTGLMYSSGRGLFTGSCEHSNCFVT